MKTDDEQKAPVMKRLADEIQQNLDERNALVTDSLRSVYDSLEEFTTDLNDAVNEKQKNLNAKLGALFAEIENLESSIAEIEEFLHKISCEITKFIEKDQPLCN